MTSLSPEQEQYKKEQRLRMKALKVGADDPAGCRISHVYAKGDEYLIYDYDDVKGKSIMRVFIDTEVEDDPKKIVSNWNRIKLKFNEFKGVVGKASNAEFAKSVASQAVSLALNGEHEDASRILDDLIKQIKKDHLDRIKCKLSYLLSCILWLVVMTVVGLIFYLYRDKTFQDRFMTAVTIFYCCLFAAYGGFISVTRKLNNLIVEIDLNHVNYIVYGIERMLIASLSGIVAYVLIKAGIIMALVNDAENPLYGYMAISLVAGFSENYVPDLLVKMEKKEA
jgi:hypothetical protein